MGVSYSDCFDRESLTRRLKQARNGEIAPDPPKVQNAPKAGETADTASQTPATPKAGATESSTSTGASTDDTDTATPASPQSNFDRKATLAELRSLRVKELRTELAKRNIRWANMVEKEDLVQALLKAREATSKFTSSGALAPGQVTDINGDILEKELSTPASTPLLLDVYATWCGPCQMLAPELKRAAEELGDTVRVAKIDSDKFSDWASKLQVGGLPTIIVFNGEGTEVERIEGALMKDGLVQLARKNM